jgi:hypothetical protein
MAIALLGALLGSAAQAQLFPTGKVFDLTVGVNSTYQQATDKVTGGTVSAAIGFTSVTQLLDSAKTSGLSSINAAYNSNSASVIRLGYRGLPIVISTQANSTQIVFSVPGLNQVTVFNARNTRDGNLDDLRAYLKSDGGSVLNRLQQLLAKASPVDPVAGNPNSLQSQMVVADFDRNFTAFASNIKESGGQSNNLIGVGVGFGSFTQGGVTSQSWTLPLSYTFRSDIDPGRQLSFYAPVSVSTVAGARSYAVNLGTSYRLPINENWAVTPGVGYGINGSVDLGSAAALMAASVTSQYSMRLDGYDLSIGNMVGISQSRKFTVGGYSFDPMIRNTIFRNGALLSMPTSAMGQKMALEFSFVNTVYTGTDLFSRQYNELGLALGTAKSSSARSYLRGGVTYLQGQNGIKGFKLNFGYWF